MTLDSLKWPLKMSVYLVLQSQVEEGGRSRGVALAITCISLLQSLFQRVYRVVWGWEMHTRPQHISVNGDCNPQFLSGLITFKITHFAGISCFLFQLFQVHLGLFSSFSFLVVFLQKSDFVGRKVQCEYSSQPPDQFNFQ